MMSRTTNAGFVCNYGFYIVKYLGSLKKKTHLHIILEYVENGSHANIIKPNKFGPFPKSLVAIYIAQFVYRMGMALLAFLCGIFAGVMTNLLLCEAAEPGLKDKCHNMQPY
ncbi:hypothetical protein L6452_09263 [Arctium lappa]|uniref:Uncharacterized protein n=1 Tax=Arctium lappa TaxID=4217 RepID=A0ACB9DJV0_ARCLA|nr:hypothetical protein L6452_09263 [Arctium lappa]